ncbi:MAG: right-handed parallel beta-helix repeat-containing protein [bacterium]|nr:right-handed parallel beta-helix repeat-containing protein [bacterium]
MNDYKKYYQTLFLILFFLLIAYSLPLNATIRFVSKTGSSIPPYTSWETAADSIQKCINISVFGDTIYVANGVYQEQVVMIPGLALIGAGTDSCVVDSRIYPPSGNKTITMKDSCLVTGFYIRTSNDFNYGYGIYATGQNGLITENKFSNSNTGILLWFSDIQAYRNYYFNLRIGVLLYNSNSRISRNDIFTLAETLGEGIYITADNSNYKPVIDSNYIETKSNGITKSPGTRSTITNNIIILKGGIDGIFLHSFASDSNWVFNNKIYAEQGIDAIYTNGSNHLYIVNNYATGNFQDLEYVISIGPNHSVKNNVVTNAERGIEAWGTQNLIFKYNNVWNNDINYYGFTPDTTNLSVDPMVVNDDTTQGDLDFHLEKYSPLIDAGDPTILDRDGSRSDIGLYGGPYGWTYTYEDLAPRPPHNVTATIEEGLVKLTWNKNTEADFSHYRIYRDTVTILIYDSTKMIAETPDTFYYDQLPPVNKETRFYYVITAFDNQGNQSYPSEEINVLVTGLGEHPPKGYDGYRLLANYPNPFNPSTKIPYRLKERGHVRLSIYDLKGELVRILVNEWQEKGYYEVVFQPNAEDKSKITKFEVMMGKTYSHMSSGMYIYSIQVIDERNIPVFTDSEKMILLK